MRSAATLAAAVTFGIVAQLLFFAHPAGLNVTVATVLFLVLLWLVRRRTAHRDPIDLWMPGAALLFAGFSAVRADLPLVVADGLAALGLCAASGATFAGLRLTRLPASELIVAGLRTTGSLLASAATLLRPATAAIVPMIGGRAAAYLVGVVLAAPLVVIFAFLFSSADAIFAKALEDAAAIVSPALIRELPGRIALGCVGAWLAGGAFAGIRPSTAGAPRIQPRLAAEPALAMLATIVALFAGFVVLQLAYLFGGLDTRQASGLQFSAYARRGFIELIAVTALVGLLLFTIELQLRVRRLAHLRLELALLGLTAVVLASAWYRLDLYQRAYGWTELRVYALAGIAFCGIALMILGWCIANRGMRHALQPVAIAVVVVGLVLNAIGPTALVARADIARVTGATELPADAERTLDACYLVSLGDGAIPALVALLPTIPKPDHDRLEMCLRREAARRVSDPAPWQSWNSDHAAARDALQRLIGR